ncbi:MAG: universal stress protein [Xanthomonadales bacterium]|nr:universal stress protein [Xanthomonadales bacterium]
MSSVLMVGVDGSNCGGRAVEYAAEHAGKSGARLYVAYVIEWSPFSFSTVQENMERHKRREEELKRAYSEIIDPIVSRLKSEGLDVVGLVRHGDVAETLQILAKENDVTNIIVGRQGTSKLKAHVFGSVGSHLVQGAECAVTVVP